jgi:hypothetical protein
MSRATAEQVNSVINNSTGTEQYHKNPFFPVFWYTDGIRQLAEVAGAYWLIDAIFSHNRQETFQCWDLVVKGSKAHLTMKEDTDKPFKVSQRIPCTDFPEGNWGFYLVNGVLMVKTEY